MDGYFGFDDLTKDQLTTLKQNYLVKLSDEGILNEVIYGKPEDDENPETAGVSYGELADADNLVPDEVLRNEDGDTMFTEEDFI